MKVTVKFDEAAAMVPSEVKVQQEQAERARQYARKWVQAGGDKPAVGSMWMNIGELIAQKGVAL